MTHNFKAPWPLAIDKSAKEPNNHKIWHNSISGVPELVVLVVL